MNQPTVIREDSFQKAWIKAVKLIKDNNWEYWNLSAHITNTTAFDHTIHSKVSSFCDCNGLIGPKHVAYTIFPHKQYQRLRAADILFRRYNDRFYGWTRKRPHRGWGTYFRRMTHYKVKNGNLNQLQQLINAINNRDKTHKAAYTITIQEPGGETVRPLGSPCLNYIAVQLEPRTLSLLCVYRNHDFLGRAYGNYWGVCNLLMFLAKETNLTPGCLTCISSHAYIPKARIKLMQLVNGLI